MSRKGKQRQRKDTSTRSKRPPALQRDAWLRSAWGFAWRVLNHRLTLVVLAAVLSPLLFHYVPIWLAPPTTEHRIFTPETGGQIGHLYISKTVSGDCYSISFRNPGAVGAHACQEDSGRFHDPCYETALGSGLICFPNPWHEDPEVLFNPEDYGFLELPKALQPPEPAPWALELENGARCVFSPNSQFELPRGPLGSTYFCAEEPADPTPGSADGWVIGEIQVRGSPTWTVAYRPYGAPATESVRVVTEWR
jgi:hypothetical protein